MLKHFHAQSCKEKHANIDVLNFLVEASITNGDTFAEPLAVTPVVQGHCCSCNSIFSSLSSLGGASSCLSPCNKQLKIVTPMEEGEDLLQTKLRIFISTCSRLMPTPFISITAAKPLVCSTARLGAKSPLRSSSSTGPERELS